MVPSSDGVMLFASRFLPDQSDSLIVIFLVRQHPYCQFY